MTSASPTGDSTGIIHFIDRESGRLETETVYGGRALDFLLGTRLGRFLNHFVTRAWLARLMGWHFDRRWSRRRIASFVRDLKIPAEDCEFSLKDYPTFNAFFSRRLRSGVRPIDPDPAVYLSGADARILVYPRIPDAFVLKGVSIDLAGLLEDLAEANALEGGAAIVYRLAPCDYHRFHFPDAGRAGSPRRIPGRYHSVNPAALAQARPIFLENVREVSFLDSASFGRIAIVEVGAAGVGGIVQTYPHGALVGRGDEKGYFRFGASTVVHLVPEGRVEFDGDLIEASERGVEVLVRCGSRLGSAGNAEER